MWCFGLKTACSVWIDTHIHLDAAEYSGNHAALIAQARLAGVQQWVIPAVDPNNFNTVRNIAHETDGAGYAHGIHPMYVDRCPDDGLERLQAALEAHKNDPKLVAVGEIGLDYFVPNQTVEQLQKQQHFFTTQLKLAARYDLPVLLHVRRSVDHIAKYLRQHPVCGGIAHAFNGSAQQAQSLIDLKLCLGFGGAATYSRALQIRERLATVNASAIVLETDGPDIAPEWLSKHINPPAALARIGESLATVRGAGVAEFAALCRENSLRVLPKLAGLSSVSIY
jgi:TatD DNase family protein